MLKFRAVLTNVPFDRQYKNVLRFENREAQESFFDVASLFLDAEEINFNAGSLIETTIIYNVRENESINDLLSKNYCIIKDENTNATLKYYYFFVKNAIQDSATQLKVWLELDVFQTYYIDLEFTDCEILKAHLNTLVDNGDNETVSFDGTTNSPLFERENIKNVAKRLTKRTKLKLKYTQRKTLNDWLNENVACWEYAFVKTKDFAAYVYDNDNFISKHIEPNDSLSIKDNDEKLHDTKIIVLCVPIMKTNKAISIYYSSSPERPRDYNTGQFGIKNFPINTYGDIQNKNGIDIFTEANGGDAYILAKKYSNVPPFMIPESALNLVNYKTETVQGFETETLELCFDVTEYNRTLGRVAPIFTATSGEKETFFVIKQQRPFFETEEYEIDDQITFAKNEIIGADKDPKFNPKLLSMDFKELHVLNQSQNAFAYDIQKINKSKFKLKITEPLCADITKQYIRIAETNGVYIPETEENFTGSVSANDTSLILVTDKFQEMLANQKNFFQQNSINRGISLAKSIVGGGISLASGGVSAAKGLPLGVVAGIGHGATQIGMGLTDFISSKIQENLTVDNMKNAPADVQNAQGNVFLGIMTTDMGIYIEEYDVLYNEKEIANDNMCKYGFTYNKIGNIKDFDNIRKYYNYVQANLEEMHGINISNAVHDIFVNCFANGVRFWNADVFNTNNVFSYAKHNYEKWLEE